MDPKKRRDKVYIGCGAGFGGDRPMAALKLLQRVKQLNYLVLECLAERTLADCFQTMSAGGDGYDSRSMFFFYSIIFIFHFHFLFLFFKKTNYYYYYFFDEFLSFRVDEVAPTIGCRERNLHYYQHGCK